MNRAINYLNCKIFYGITCDEKIIYYAAVQQHCSSSKWCTLDKKIEFITF